MPRIHYPGALYHVMLRGNGGAELFSEDPNRQYFEALVAGGVARFGHRIHAYCWMSNHVHLALQVADIPLSKITQNLAFHYTRWFNKQHCRQGHLFQGRHKAILVDQDAYLLQLVRYIYLNPVRVGLVSNPCAYPWSGHLGYLGERRIDWLSTDWVLSQFAPYKALARRRYERYVLAGTKEGHRNEFHTGSEGRRLLWDDRFIKRVFKDQGERCGQHLRTLDLKRLVEILCEELDVEPATLAQPGKCREAAAIKKVDYVYLLGMGRYADRSREIF